MRSPKAAAREYVLDANAVIRQFAGDEAGGSLKVQELIRQTQMGSTHLFMSVINLGEVYYTLLKTAGESTAATYIGTLRNFVYMVPADADQALEAAGLKHRYKLGYADSYAAALAIGRKATLVSADPAFEKLGTHLKWMRLPGHRP
ncbi:type II toxin-antitoxin system VapC family toxin [Paracidobacterium acidisoli]|uniref:Type II toxin-antitoxin system VapC family toxin n=1 Tax=Paracidobacterium acidisoli TaxID=2303751 RepID=A0A372ILQ2_9BACT|nr:type II toxin-antitoxin system VapC family toxin [Paracidobacterium acidisoli]